MEAIYLDNNATTKVDDRVFVAIRPYLTNHFGHPSGPHPFGIKVREKIEEARDLVAVLLGTAHDSRADKSKHESDIQGPRLRNCKRFPVED